MSRAAVSTFTHGVIVLALSLTFFAIPDVALRLLGLPAHKDVFLYVAAMLLVFLGIFFITAARDEDVGFFRVSILTRYSVPFFLGAMVTLGQAKANLLLFAPLDVITATWTLLALRADAKQRASAGAPAIAGRR